MVDLTKSEFEHDICIVGGCGHVGLPLGLAFADKGKRVVLYDINKDSVDKVNKGEMPFLENGAEELLKDVLKAKRLKATNDARVISKSKAIVLVVGTPVDEHLNPKIEAIINAVKQIQDHFSDNQLLVLRSTLYPGVTEKVHKYLWRNGIHTRVAFCPERIAEGHALTELYELPQIVAGSTEAASQEAKVLFHTLASKVIIVDPLEAELAKLFTNTWRYINFAISNQFYMMANAHGLDFYKIFDTMTDDYPRLKNFSKAGLAAGPCLFKDTMQLATFSGNNFMLGHSAMLINEGLPDFVVDAMLKKFDLEHRTVAIMGMAFKGNNDDPRESLSYKFWKRLKIEAGVVLCHDPYIKDSRFSTMEEVKARADIIVLAAPHTVYAEESWEGKDLVDIWNFYGNGGLV
jgi:UDP-N-acetyl-D-mannosaminuronic acid dehydrogenase